MQLFGYVLRLPWVKYVDLTIDDNVHDYLRTAIAKSVVANFAIESLEADLCDDDCEVLQYLKKISKGDHS